MSLLKPALRLMSSYRLVIEEVAEMLAPKAEEKVLDIVLQYPPGVPSHFIGDAGRIRQVVTNLVMNSLIHAYGDGEAGALRLEVSERTVYRDVRDLSLSGVPIEGEAGVGYALRRDFDLPPLMFDYEEIEALTAGARMVQAWSSPKLAASRS